MAKQWHRKDNVLVFLVGGWFSFLFTKKYTAQCTLGLEMEDRLRESVSDVAFSEYADGRYAEYAYCFAGYVSGYFFSVPFQKELIYSPLYIGERGDTVTFITIWCPVRNVWLW
ncbi:MAG: hypothetical protein ACLUOS_13235 [Odoribacter splanchnicus]